MTSHIEIQSAGDLIDRLGGNRTVGEIAGVGSSAVSNWRKNGCLPPRLYLKFLAAGKELGVPVPEVLFREVARESQAA